MGVGGAPRVHATVLYHGGLVGVLGKCWLESRFRQDQILRACVEEGARIPMFWSPSLFYVPKAKSDEVKNMFKWRNMISQALHPLRRFSKLIGRCLSLLVKEITILSPHFSLPAMIGVRDMFFASSKARSTTLPSTQLEMDIDNCFWNLDKDGVPEKRGYGKGTREPRVSPTAPTLS